MDDAAQVLRQDPATGVLRRGLAWGAGCGAVLGGLYFPVATVLAALNGVSGEVGTVVLGLLPAAAAGALVGVVVAAAAAAGLLALAPRRRRRGWGLTVGAAVLAAVVSGAAPGAVGYLSDGDFPSGWAAVVAAVALLPAVWVLRRLVREPADLTPRRRGRERDLGSRGAGRP